MTRRGAIELGLLRFFIRHEWVQVLLRPLIELASVPGVEWIVHAGILMTLLGWLFDLNLRDALFVGDDAHHDLEGARCAGLEAVDVAALATLRDLQVP